jgi:branched-chain amino acid transport system substrate-binding protein
MRNKFAAGLVGALMTAAVASAHAQSGDVVRFGLCYDLTKSYPFITPQVTQAAKDYAAIINAGGGLEGKKVEIVVQDTGNEPQRGIECYERLKREGVMIFDTLSSPVANALLPRVMNDGVILLQSLVGRGEAIDGKTFKWIFPIGPTVWAQAANNIQYIKDQSKGNLKGKKIAYVHVDHAFGHEPVELMKTLAAKEGFELQIFPYPLPGNDQTSAWTQIRRLNPDWIIHWGFSNMHAVASREAKRNGIGLERVIGANWMNEVDIANIGEEAAKGLKRGSNVLGGTSHPLIQQILKDLYGNNKGNGDRKHTNDVYYNTGLAMYSVAFEGVRLAIKNEGWPLNPEKIKKGFESIRNFDANGLMAPMTVTEADHGGGGRTRVDMWDGTKWVAQSDWMAAYPDVVSAIVKSRVTEYAKTVGK